MRSRAAPIGLLLLLATTFVAACAERPVEPSPSPTPSAPNACTAFPRPSVDLGAGTTIRGSNAMAYLLLLVCDHQGPVPREQYRLPGTEGQLQAQGLLRSTLEGLGWTARIQAFNGSDYEAILLDETQTSSYKFYYTSPNYCTAEDRVRMRGLPFGNVEARLGAASDPLVLLMAHWDSKRYASSDPERTRAPVLGANDGGSGVGVLLEVARALAHDPPNLEVRILLTDGEDGFQDCHPLAGSTVYADGMSAEDRNRVRAILLLDMVGDANATFPRGCGRDAALADRIWAIAGRLDVQQFVDEASCGVTDDHTPFEDRGLDAVDVISVPFPDYWHTTQDTPDKISPDLLGDVARVVQELLRELSTA